MLKNTLRWGLATAISLASAAPFAETLHQTYLLALDNDHQLKADQARYQAGLETQTIGRAALLPQINASAQFSDTSQDYSGYQNGAPTGGQVNVDVATETYAVTLTQPLFNMAAWFGYQQSKTLSEQAEAQFSADQQSLIIRVAEAYFNVLSTIDNLQTAIAEQNALSHQLEQTRQRFEVGLTAITDVHEAQSAYDTSVANTLSAKGNLGIAFEQLEVLTGKPMNSVAPLLDNFPVSMPVPQARQDWVDFAINNNYNLKVAKLSAESARDNARAKASNHLPTITGSLTYTDYDDTDTKIFGNNYGSEINEGSTVAVSVNVPIFSGMRVSGERRQAYQQSMQSEELFNQALRDTIQSARSLHLSVATDVAQIKARNQATISSQSALEATQAGYEVGTRNLVDVLNAQRTLFEAQRNYDSSRYAYVLDMLKLKQAAGNLTPEDILTLNQWLDDVRQVERQEFEG